VHVRLLLLGGTGEARALAAALAERPVEVISSLAGRVSNPALPVGAVRIGGFGGVPGLAEYLRGESIDAVVDATHPFAATISANAAAATSLAGVPSLVLRRDGWYARQGDHWTRVPDIVAAAAAASTAGPGTVFLTTGKRDLAVFAADVSHHYLVRVVDPPEAALPPSHTLLLSRGPYTLDGERALMREHDIALLVTKDSGGAMTAAKLDAARELELPVIMVDRPPLPAGVEVAADVDTAVAWVLGYSG
jgi:precorrin-6A/cobalt-precorrin-6A reductase